MSNSFAPPSTCTPQNPFKFVYFSSPGYRKIIVLVESAFALSTAACNVSNGWAVSVPSFCSGKREPVPPLPVCPLGLTKA